MKYLVISFEDQISLTEKVNLLISQGWKPQGGVSVSISAYEYENLREGSRDTFIERIYAQAMIHEGVE